MWTLLEFSNLSHNPYTRGKKATTLSLVEIFGQGSCTLHALKPCRHQKHCCTVVCVKYLDWWKNKASKPVKSGFALFMPLPSATPTPPRPRPSLFITETKQMQKHRGFCDITLLKHFLSSDIYQKTNLMQNTYGLIMWHVTAWLCDM